MRWYALWLLVLSMPPAIAQEQTGQATLLFEIRDENRQLIPARLTFITSEPRTEPLLRDTQVDPGNLAIRDNVVYTRTGRGTLKVPPGNYEIMASRGLEYSIKHLPIRLTAGKATLFEAELKRQVNSTGWVSGDFHLHTLTHSGHGDANMNERIISLVGEGVEFAVATDHNHNIDYDPTIKELELGTQLRAVVGNEVSTPIGHFNAFPLDPTRPVPPSNATDANKLFKLIRAETNAFDVVPVIQLNHPRWAGIDYFTQVQLDPLSGEGGPGWSGNFDTIELLNENEGWGYYDAERLDGREYGSSRYSVLQDWFNLLNRGQRVAAVGNSDSHAVQACIAGLPRNFVRSETDVVPEIDPGEIAENLRRMDVFTTTGPFVTYAVEKVHATPDPASDFELVVTAEVQTTDWIEVDHALLVRNGDIVDQQPITWRPGEKMSVTLRTRGDVGWDSWVTVIVAGSKPLPAAISPRAKRPILPLAICNPTFIRGRDGSPWVSPLANIRTMLQNEAPTSYSVRESQRHRLMRTGLLPTEHGLLLIEAARLKHPYAEPLIREAFQDRPTRAEPGDEVDQTRRSLKLRAARAAALLGSPTLADPLRELLPQIPNDDPYLRAVTLRALLACDPDGGQGAVAEWLEGANRASLGRYGAEIFGDRPATIVRDWKAVGYFANPSRATLVGVSYGPERERAAESYEGRDGPVRWQTLQTDERGFLDVTQLGEGADNSISYARCAVYSETARRVIYAVGTDDGGRMWLNRELVHEDTGRHGATPFQHVGSLKLRAGWNDVLLKVENGGGPSGLYLRFFDQQVRLATEATEG